MAKESKGETHLITAYFEDEMKTSYLNYAYSVITSRAIPDIRDGLKPVHRRILYAMSELSLWHDKPTRKSARVVGDVLGKYHPHGDSSVYMAMVKMAQDFSIRYPLVVGQGNFGSIDDDPPAAMRYTEAKLSRIAEYLLEDLEKETVDFRPNFDETLKEPKVFPGKFPFLLCNGTTGIAVGFATDIPPHNLKEVAAGIGAYLDDPKITTGDLMKYVQGPDFPTHGIITNKQDLPVMYETGHGSINLAGKITVEESGGQKNLVITEIPYRIIKSKIVEEITNLMLDAKHKYRLIAAGIKEVRDESSKEGIRIVVYLNREADPDSIRTILYNTTSLTTKIKVNMVVLVDNQPRVLGLRDIIHYYVEHRRHIIIKRTEFDLRKAEARLHIINGLLIALANIDEVIEVIKKSTDVPAARENLMKRFKLSEIQAQAILDMRLQKLTSLEVMKLKEEAAALEKLIAELQEILKSPKKRDGIIKKELSEMSDAVGDERRSKFGEIETTHIETEELISNDPMLLTVSRNGFIIREVGTTLKSGKRGNKGRRGEASDTDRLEQGDYIFETVSCYMKDTIIFVTDAGRVYSLKGYEFKGDMDGKITRAYIRNIERLRDIVANQETITAVLPVTEFTDNNFLIFISKMGKIAKIPLSQFDSIYKTGIIAVKLRKNDSVVGAVITDGKQKLFIVKGTAKGFKFHEKTIPVYNRGVGGAIGTSVSGEADQVIGMGVEGDAKFVLFVTTDGKGRMVKPDVFKEMSNRGAKGCKLVEIGKDRKLASFCMCNPGDEVVITTKVGRRISFPINSLSAQLLKMMDLMEGDEVSAISAISAEEENGV
jgi:DNA gyrase subunit A